MYSIFIDNVCVHDNTSILEHNKLISPRLSLKDNGAGLLEATIPPNNVCYNTAKRMKSTVSIYRQQNEIWRGRILTEEEDLYKCKKISCEGALAFLNDTIQEPISYYGKLGDFIKQVLDIHNNKVSENRKIYPGNIMPSSMHVTWEIERTTTYETITNCLLNNANGHIEINVRNGLLYFDFLTVYNDNNQSIIFGENLLDFTKTLDVTDIATVLIPFGAKLEDSDDMLTVKDINGGSICVRNEDAIGRFGYIERVVEWEDITDKYELLDTAIDYLKDFQFDNIVIRISAIDLHYLNSNIDFFYIRDNIRCISIPHGLDKHLPITEMDISIDDPSSTTITIGYENKKSISSKITNSVTKEDVKAEVKSEVKTEVQNVTQNISISSPIYNTIENITKQTVIATDVIEASAVFSEDVFTEHLQTNFQNYCLKPNINENKCEWIEENTYILSYSMPHNKRAYLDIKDVKMQFIEDEMTVKSLYTADDIEPFLLNNRQVYYTSIGNANNAYKFFTFTVPKQNADMFKVYMPKHTARSVKTEFSFVYNPEIESYETKLTFGYGDDNGNGRYSFIKDADSGRFVYTGRTDGKEYGIVEKDDGTYQRYAGNDYIMPVMKTYETYEAAENDNNLPIGGIAIIKGV